MANNTRQELWRERRPNLGQRLPNNCGAGFSGRLNTGLPNGVVIVGRQYRIELISHFKPGVLTAAQFNIRTYFDNIRLRVDDGTPFLSGPPTVVTDPATDIVANTSTTASATLNGRTNVNGVGLAGGNATYSFQYATDNDARRSDDARAVQRRDEQRVPGASAHHRRGAPELHAVLLPHQRDERQRHRERRHRDVHDAVRADGGHDAGLPGTADRRAAQRDQPERAATSYFYEYGHDNNNGTFTDQAPAPRSRSAAARP